MLGTNYDMYKPCKVYTIPIKTLTYLKMKRIKASLSSFHLCKGYAIAYR